MKKLRHSYRPAHLPAKPKIQCSTLDLCLGRRHITVWLVHTHHPYLNPLCIPTKPHLGLSDGRTEPHCPRYPHTYWVPSGPQGPTRQAHAWPQQADSLPEEVRHHQRGAVWGKLFPRLYKGENARAALITNWDSACQVPSQSTTSNNSW